MALAAKVRHDNRVHLLAYNLGNFRCRPISAHQPNKTRGPRGHYAHRIGAEPRVGPSDGG